MKCHLLLFCATMNHFSIGLWCATKSGFYITTCKNQLSDWTEKKLQSTSQSQTCTKKGHGHCFVVCSQSYPLQLPKSQRNHYIWEVCSPNEHTSHWRDAPKLQCLQLCATGRAQFFSMTIPDHTLYHQCFKSWMNWATMSYLICHIHLTSCQLSLLQASQQLFAGKMFPQPAGGRKCFPRVCRIPKRGFLCYRNKQTYFLLAKKCVDCNGSYFD